MTVTATDDGGLGASDTFRITVARARNRAPTVANPIPDQSARKNERFDYAFPADTFGDPDGDSLTYAASGMPSWLSFAPPSRRFSGTPRTGDAGTSEVTVTAYDVRGGRASDVFSITVAANRPPTVRNPIPDRPAAVRERLDYAFPANTFDDPDGDALTYAASGMPSWLSFAPAERLFWGTPGPEDTGASDVTVTADDGDGGRASDTFRVRVDRAPVVPNPIPDRIAAVDVPFSYTFPRNTFRDQDGDPLTYTASGMPSWLSFAAAERRFSGTPQAADEGASDVTVTATDDGGLSVSDTFRITVEAAGNRAPTVANPIPDVTVAEDEYWRYPLPEDTFHDPDGDELTLAATGLPSWLHFSTRYGPLFWGTPTSEDRGTSIVTVTADDGRGGTVDDVFSVTVTSTTEQNRPPTVAHPIPNQSATVDERFDYAFPSDTFADGDGDSLTYAAAGMPSWLSFAAASRRFSGTPGEDDTGATDVTVTADDGNGGTVDDVFSITVPVPPQENRAPTVANPIPDFLVTEDLSEEAEEPFDYAFPADTFHDADGDPLTYTASGMPSWLSFAASSRRFTGNPTHHDAGTSDVTVTASDGSLSASDTFRIRVNRPPGVNNPMPDRNASVDVLFRYTFPANTFYDKDGDPLTYTVSGMPSWLSFAPAERRFSGTPLAGDEGTADVTVTASDDGGASASDTFRITVEPAGNRAPTVANPIPDLTVDADLRSWSYNVPANTFDDPDEDTLTYTATGMPSWLHFSERHFSFSGSPNEGERGTSTVTLTADDGRGGSVDDVFSITVGSSASASVSGALLTLSWPTPRDAFAAPYGSDFAVRADGAPLAVVATAVSGDAALLAISPPVLPGQAVLVDYLGSAMHPLRGVDGTEDPPWRDLAATNLTEPDATVDPNAFAAPLAPEVRALPAWLLREGAPRSPGLVDLSLAGTGLGDADIVPLARLRELRRLDLSGNALADLSPLGGLTALESLDLSDNDVADLWPLAGLAALRRLDVSGNRVEDLSPLGGLGHLEVLVVDANLVTDAGALAHLARLENLGLADNAVADLAPLADLASLRRLDLGGNPVRDASPLGDLGTLVWLRLPETAAAPAERLVRLRWLWSEDGECLACPGSGGGP